MGVHQPVESYALRALTSDEDSPAMMRPADAHEAHAILALVRDAYGRWVERLGREPGPMRDDYAQRIAAGEVWVMDVEGELVGLVVLTERPESFLLQNVAVAPAAQGQGYGRRLITFAEDEAKRRGYDELRLYTNVLMGENIALYQHLGFREIGRIHEQGFDRVSMAKSVT
jgi:ribosomal protein S18 acetylase RimI-like enzyme